MNNKNVLIGGLLAVVLVMAIGYAAFSSQLNITAPSSIGSGSTGDDYWKVAFDSATTSGTSYGTATCGTITYSNNDMTATISNTSLSAPGDYCLYTLTIKNSGQLNATLGTLSLTGQSCTVSGLTCTSSTGYIKFTVTNPLTTSLNSGNTTTMTVKAEFPSGDVSSASEESADLSVTLTATQS